MVDCDCGDWKDYYHNLLDECKFAWKNMPNGSCGWAQFLFCPWCGKKLIKHRVKCVNCNHKWDYVGEESLHKCKECECTSIVQISV